MPNRTPRWAVTKKSRYITEEFLDELEKEMLEAAEALEFERAAALRDRIEQMRDQVGKRMNEAEIDHATRSHRGRRRKKKKAAKRVPKPGKALASQALKSPTA